MSQIPRSAGNSAVPELDQGLTKDPADATAERGGVGIAKFVGESIEWSVVFQNPVECLGEPELTDKTDWRMESLTLEKLNQVCGTYSECGRDVS
jgi:hypothetical protein